MTCKQTGLTKGLGLSDEESKYSPHAKKPIQYRYELSNTLDLFHKSKYDLSIADYLYRRILNIHA